MTPPFWLRSTAHEQMRVATGATGREAMLDDESVWPRIIGPCYTAESLARELAITTDEVVSAADDLRVLRLVAADDVSLFPSFQVRGGRIPYGLDVVLRVLRIGFDSPMMWAQWLAHRPPRPADGQKRRIDELHEGRVLYVLRDAVDTAAAWARHPAAADQAGVNGRPC